MLKWINSAIKMCVLVDARLPQTLLRYGQNDPIIINIEVQVNKKIEFFLWASSSEMPDRRHQCGWPQANFKMCLF